MGDEGENDLVKESDSGSQAGQHIFTQAIDNGIIRCEAWADDATCEEHAPPTELLKVRFLSLITVLVLEPLELEEHDIYVCFEERNPFSYYQPGYFGDTNQDGKCQIGPTGGDLRSIGGSDAELLLDNVKKNQEKVSNRAGTYTLDSV